MSKDTLTQLGYAHPLTTHPRAYILEEMQARGWSPQELAERLGAGEDGGLNALGWCLYFAANDPGVRLGEESAADLARVFGTSAEFWLELEQQWLERVEG